MNFREYLELEEAKMTDEEVKSVCKKLVQNGDEKAKKFGQGLLDFYKKNDSFTPDQVAGLQNIMKKASFQLAKKD
jgi:polyhydroxyalkanoate synthesis regulator phasin